MSNKPRQRLTVAERRAQLIAVGSAHFADRPYDDVWIDDVAAAAGVSRGLIYHYFESKRGFLHAVIEHATSEILAATTPPPALPPREQLRASLEGYLAYVTANPEGYRALFKGTASSDERVRELVSGNLRRQEERILAAYGTAASNDPRTRLAVHGWLAFLVAIVLEWLEERTVEAAAIIDLAMDALDAALAPAGSRRTAEA